jgi:glucokinase
MEHCLRSLGGHTVIDYNGQLCNCGSVGCAETVASTWALPQIIGKHPLFNKSTLKQIDKPEFLHVFQEAGKGDALAYAILQQCLKAWGAIAVNMVHNFDPEIIIVSGGIMQSASAVIPYMQNAVDKYTWLSAGSVKIMPATQIEYAGLLGMAFIVSEKTKL